MGLHRVLLEYGLTDTMAGVAMCHLTLSLPYAVVALLGSFKRLDADMESQARLLGAGPWRVWWHVTLPVIAPGVAVGFSLAFLVSWSQYLATLFIGGGRVITLPLQLVSFQRGGDEAVAAALALVFLGPAVLVLSLVGRSLRA
jgi:putative spermidine/putrescine transport system permease protein